MGESLAWLKYAGPYYTSFVSTRFIQWPTHDPAGEKNMISVTLKPSQRRNVPVPDKSDYVMGNWRIGPHAHAWRPPTDVFEREDTLVVRVEIAGMNETD